jgi:Mn-dependent DtxR family transcriptional regulator
VDTSNEEISARMRVTERHVTLMLAKLESVGLISRIVSGCVRKIILKIK